MFKLILIFIFLLLNLQLYSKEIGSVTGYDIPRFVSIKSNDVNLRIGSSTNYPIILKYIKKNLPVEITNEYGHWRKIRDFEGNEGWLYKDLIKGERHGIIIEHNNSSTIIYSNPNGKSIGKIGKLNIVRITTCLQNWCKIKIENYKGWIKKKNIWGVYLEEEINIPFYQPLINIFWQIKF